MSSAIQSLGAKALDQALSLYREGQPAIAETICRQIIAECREGGRAFQLLGVMLAQQRRLSDGQNFIARAATILADDAAVHHDLAVARAMASRSTEAARAYRRSLALMPDFAAALGGLAGILAVSPPDREDAVRLYRRSACLLAAGADLHFSLGNLLSELKRPQEALISYKHALDLNPFFAEAHVNTGNALLALTRKGLAATHYRRALALLPAFGHALNNLGNVLADSRHVAQAAASFHRSLHLAPDSPEAHFALARALLAARRTQDAVDVYRRGLELQPDHAQARSDLGNAVMALQHTDVAIAAYRQALAVQPALVDAHNNLGMALSDQGHAKAAAASVRRALAVDPGAKESHSNLIFTLDLIPEVTLAEQQDERKAWYARHARHLMPVPAQQIRDPSPDRRFRIGYVSADFFRHSAAKVFGPAVLNHDHSRFDVAMYAASDVDDEETLRFKAAATLWRDASGTSDDELATRIRDDRIDILVDLSGHSKGNRLLVFARKPAPLQVTAWGHVTGTGLSAIDYVFADAVLIAAEDRHLFAESIFDLPCFLPYDPPAYAPEPAPRPSAGCAAFTYGCLNRLAKVSDAALDVWGEILRRNPASRLLMKDGRLSQPAVRERILNEFRRRGVDPSRIVLRGSTPHLEQLLTFAEVDIALDPFPQNGGVSTLEPLWMGVPVVPLLGTTPPGRASGAILSAVGHGEWVARSEASYVEIATRLADSPDLLDHARRTLRAEVIASTVGDPVAYSRATEAAYREIWRRACARR